MSSEAAVTTTKLDRVIEESGERIDATSSSMSKPKLMRAKTKMKTKMTRMQSSERISSKMLIQMTTIYHLERTSMKGAIANWTEDASWRAVSMPRNRPKSFKDDTRNVRLQDSASQQLCPGVFCCPASMIPAFGP